jgi:hypothetical protein
MKHLIAAASAAVLAAVSAPAFAQGASAPDVTGYGNLGYSLADLQNGPSLSALGGRLGARFARYFGVEGEAAFGVGSKSYGGADVKLKSSVAGYAIGFLPVQPNFDVFARVGYGHDTIKATAAGVSSSAGEDSVNYGGGVQAFFTPHDGVRAEYTRHDLRHNGGTANVWSVSYVRKFP